MAGRGESETRRIAWVRRARAGLALALLLGLGGCERYEGVVTYLLPDLFLLPAPKCSCFKGILLDFSKSWYHMLSCRLNYHIFN